MTVDAGVAEDATPFGGHNFHLRELEGRMRKAAADLEFEEAARLRDEIKRLKMLDLEFANEALTPEGEQADRNAAKLAKAEARAEAAERYRRGGTAAAGFRAAAQQPRAPSPTPSDTGYGIPRVGTTWGLA